MTRELSISTCTHTHIPNSSIPMTKNLQCPVNACQRGDCSCLANDQIVLTAFFEMDSWLLHISTFWMRQCMKAVSQQLSLCSKMSFFNSTLLHDSKCCMMDSVTDVIEHLMESMFGHINSCTTTVAKQLSTFVTKLCWIVTTNHLHVVSQAGVNYSSVCTLQMVIYDFYL